MAPISVARKTRHGVGLAVESYVTGFCSEACCGGWSVMSITPSFRALNLRVVVAEQNRSISASDSGGLKGEAASQHVGFATRYCAQGPP